MSENSFIPKLESLIRKGLIKKNGASLKLILDELDYYERVLPTHAEINDALKGLTGKVERTQKDVKLIKDNECKEPLVITLNDYTFICSKR